MIHGDNPFAQSEDSPVRRFRGRLASPVTIITAGDEATRTGLTVSSLMVVEGQPPMIHAVVTPGSDLYDVAADSGRFVVHICDRSSSGLADVFAGIRPNPGGLFSGTATDQTDFGPVLADLPNRLFCRTASTTEAGWSGLMVGQIDRVEVTGLDDPLVYFRGGYRGLG